MAVSRLNEGIALSRARKWRRALVILEKGLEDEGAASWRYLYTLALCRLHTGDILGAYECFREAVKITQEARTRSPELLPLLGVAAVYIRRRDSARASDFYLQVLDAEGDAASVKSARRFAQKALDMVKKCAADISFDAFLESGKWKRLIPPPLALPPRARAARLARLSKIPAIILGAAAVLALGGFLLLRNVRFDLPFSLPAFLAKEQPPLRAGLAESSLNKEEKNAAVSLAGSFHYVLTEKEVLAEYEKARRLFTDYRDEAAKVCLNRIALSNASDGIKNKAALLRKYTEAPDWTSLKDRFDYAAVMKDPPLYAGCYVIWRGMLANVVNAENATDFDLLVGYDKKTAVEGIVHVHFGSAVAVNSDAAFEVMGEIAVTADGKNVSLAGAAVHQLR